MIEIITWVVLIFVVLFGLSGIRIVQQTERGLIETMGKFSRFANPGFNYIIPIFQGIRKVNITEQMMEIDTQEIITEDNLNAKVDLVVYYKVSEDEDSVKKSVYKVEDFEPQITRLAQTTARNVIGTMLFKDVNSKRSKLNQDIAKILKIETKSWGVEIVRVELKDITPPQDVQDTMNKVIQAENTKRAAVDFATAKETEADGIKRAKIKEAEGEKQSQILKAEGAATAFNLVNKSFKGGAKELKQLEVSQNALQNNAKIILGQNGKDVLKLFNIDK